MSLIDGHVSGKYRPGIFKNLKNLSVGDSYEVEFGDLSRRRFEVVSVKSYGAGEAAEAMRRQAPIIDKQLNLITCDGRFDPETGRYENRILVVNKRIK